MKYKIIATIVCLFFISTANSYSTNKEGYNIEIHAPLHKGSIIYLANYWQGQTYTTDSTTISESGVSVFTGDRSLPTGQYLLYIKPDIQIEMLLSENDQQNINIKISKDLDKSKITGSNDTKLFWDYINHSNKLNQEVQNIASNIQKTGLSEKERTEIAFQYKKKLEEIDDFIDQQVHEHQGTWFSAFINASRENRVPNIPPKTKDEYRENLNYTRLHYFDRIDFTDIRLWRTSFFAPMINRYLEEVVVQYPDTIANEASKLVKQTINNDEAFEMLLSYLTNRALESSRMGMENVWAKLAEDYIFDKHLTWISNKQYDDLKAEYALIEQNRIGMRAQNLQSLSIEGDSINTNAIDADYTLLYFYSTDCSHCEHDMPVLRQKIFTKYKDRGLKIIAFNVGRDNSAWKKFVSKHSLTTDGWINISDPNFTSDYWLKYNVSGTPSLYLLDKEKKIVAKKINLKNLEQYLDYIINTDINGTN